MYRLAAHTIVRLHLAVPRSEDPVEELLPLALAYRETALAHPNLYRLLFERAIPDFQPSDEDAAYCLQSLVRVHDTVERCVRIGRFPGRETWRTTRELWAMVHGLASLELQKYLGEPEEAEAAWRDMVHPVIRSFTEPAAPSSPEAIRA
jgi:AcrR family transcriptional regulator